MTVCPVISTNVGKMTLYKEPNGLCSYKKKKKYTIYEWPDLNNRPDRRAKSDLGT